MNGFIINYKAFDRKANTSLHHVLFGRLQTTNYRFRKKTYYNPGILNDIKFLKVSSGKIFIIDKDNINLEELRLFGDISTEICDMDKNIDDLKTGKEYWEIVARNKGEKIVEKNGSRN